MNKVIQRETAEITYFSDILCEKLLTLYIPNSP